MYVYLGGTIRQGAEVDPQEEVFKGKGSVNCAICIHTYTPTQIYIKTNDVYSRWVVDHIGGPQLCCSKK